MIRAKFFTKKVVSFFFILVSILFLPVVVRATGRQYLHGHVPRAVKTAALLGNTAPSKKLNLAIGFPLRNQSQLQVLIKQLYDPKSFLYRHFLTPQQFADRFGPSSDDYEAVKAFMKSNGLVITRELANHEVLSVSGTVSVIQNVFHVKLHDYRRPDGTKFFAPDTEPSVDLDVPILHVSGLDNSVIPKTRLGLFDSKKSKDETYINALLKRRLERKTGSVGGELGGEDPYAGQDFRQAYASCSPLTGSTQSVGLLEYDGYYQNDIQTYENKFTSSSWAPNVLLANVLTDSIEAPSGAPLCGVPYDFFQVGEVTLDIEMAIAMAPGLSQTAPGFSNPYGVVVYEGVQIPDPFDEGYDLWLTPADTILGAMSFPPPGIPLSSQLSSSWGFSTDATTDNIFLTFAAQGQSFFMASGDFGSYQSGVFPEDLTQSGEGESYMTVVGGTSLTTDSNGNFSNEVVWNNTQCFLSQSPPPIKAISSGGIYPTPIPYYQAGIPMNPISLGGNGGSTTDRNLPDVSMVADNIFMITGNYPNGMLDGYAYFFENYFNSGGTNTTPILQNDGSYAGPNGGTSFATPLWAGFMALVNQLTQTSGFGSLGFANPSLYSIANTTVGYTSNFNDVTSGNNATNGTNGSCVPPASTTNGTNGYPAVSGYDLSTGLGSPKCSLITNLVPFASTLTPTPTPTGCCPDGSYWNQSPTNNPFIQRQNFSTVVFNNKVWVIGGTKGGTNAPCLNDVWSSSDGVNWTQVTPRGPVFAPRENHSSVVFTDPADGVQKIWVLGGVTSAHQYSDVWCSSDGVSWTKKTTTAGFSQRYAQTSVVFPDPNDGNKLKMWVIGGIVGSGFKNDIWNSVDGITWNQVVTSGPIFSARGRHTSVVFDAGLGPEMWVIAGNGTNDVWHSLNGVNWYAATTNAGFPARDSHASFVFCGKIWVVGGKTSGFPGTLLNDVWTSTNGITWNQATTGSNIFSPRFGLGAQVFQNAPVVMGGGTTGSAVTYNDLWKIYCSAQTPIGTPMPTCCPSGNYWNQIPTVKSFPSRDDFSSVVFNPGSGNKMWVLGGLAPGFGTYLNDVWASSDGTSWNNYTPTGSIFSSRYGHASVVFPDPNDGYKSKIWVIGGKDNTGALNDVWCSADGSAWTHVSTSGPIFTPRSFHTMAVMEDPNDDYRLKMWVIGGAASGGVTNDVWSSPDGVQWTMATANAGFSPRSGQGSFVFNYGDMTKMWVIAGSTSAGVTNDVWSSPDGVSWSSTTLNANFPARQLLGAFSFCDSMWVVGGDKSTLFNDVNDIWTSTNGIAWNQASPGTNVFSPRESFGTLVFQNSPWVLAGLNSTSSGNVFLNDVWEGFCAKQTPLPTFSPTFTPTGSATPTSTFTRTFTSTFTITPSPTFTISPSPTSTATFTITYSPTITPTPTKTLSPTITPTPTKTGTATSTPTITRTPTKTGTPTKTPTITFTPTITRTPTGTKTFTATKTATKTVTPTITRTSTKTPTSTSTQTATKTPTPGGPGPALISGESERGGFTLTPTPASTPAFTPTLMPSPTVSSSDLLKMVSAAPNISRNGESIQFQVILGKPAFLHLALYTLSGEFIYEFSTEGHSGSNAITWGTVNQLNQPVASGLYLYVLSAVDEQNAKQSEDGKILIIH